MAEKAGGLLYFSRTIPGVANNKNRLSNRLDSRFRIWQLAHVALGVNQRTASQSQVSFASVQYRVQEQTIMTGQRTQ